MTNSEDTNRCMGRTTRLALHYVERAIERAGEVTYIQDHWDYPQAHRRLQRMVANLLDVLGVDYELSQTIRGYRIMVVPMPQKDDGL